MSIYCYCRCGKRFIDLKSLQDHIKRKHPNVNKNEFMKSCGGVKQ